LTSIYLNGKFAAQRTTGVQRVASQLAHALDTVVAADAPSWVMLCPPGSARLALQHVEQRVVGLRGLPLHVWEQFVLPWHARGGLLLNLAGTAPWFARRQAMLLHDAAVFDHPEAYTRAFAFWYRMLFRRMARRAERLFTVSDFSRARLAARLGIAADSMVVLPNGSEHLADVVPDLGVLEQHGLNGVRFLLAVASDNPTKNLPALVAALSLLPAEPALRLVIVGGSNDQVFSGRPADADPPGVLRTGPLGDAALKALYQHAVALVFPSIYEGFGLPPLEAMACGCPVAAASAASMPEVCGNAALYFDPHSTASIAQALRRLLAEPGLCADLRQRGFARADAYRWTVSAGRLHALLRPGAWA
jgi:glycosyltransferase involved in cell wall biosynthesis